MAKYARQNLRDDSSTDPGLALFSMWTPPVFGVKISPLDRVSFDRKSEDAYRHSEGMGADELDERVDGLNYIAFRARENRD